MNYRKSWFSYVLWAIYAGVCLVCLTFAGNALYSSYISKQFAEVGGLLIFPITAVIYGVLFVLSKKVLQNAYEWRHKAKVALECVAVVVMILAVVYRIFLFGEVAGGTLTMSVPPIDGIILSEYSSYFEAAVVRNGESMGIMTYGAGLLYVKCLSLVFGFLGNKELSALLFQYGVQMITIVIGYYALRKVAGSLTALLPLCYLAFSNAYAVHAALEISPKCFVLLLYTVVFWITAGFIKELSEGCFQRGIAVCGAIFVGILCGTAIFFDFGIVTVTVLFFALFAVTGIEKISTRVVNAVIMLISAVGSFFAVAWLFAVYYYKNTFENICVQYVTTHIGKCKGGLLCGTAAYRYDFPWIILIMVFASFVVIEFFRADKEQKMSFWLLYILVSAITPLTVFSVSPNGVFPLLLWTFMAGVGLQNLLVHNCGVKTEEEAQPQEDAQVAEEPASVQKDDAVEKQTIKFIENPLPLPKKHVKKEMDYQYEIKASDMKYDVEISDDDDFDLK